MRKTTNCAIGAINLFTALKKSVVINIIFVVFSLLTNSMVAYASGKYEREIL